MKLSTGKIAFPIEFDNGDKDVIYFNPNDREFIKRVANFEKSAKARMDNISIEKYKTIFDTDTKIDIDINDTEALLSLSDDEKNALFKRMEAVVDIDAECQQVLKEELNDIFKSDVSSVIFKYCQPTDMVVVTDENGEEKSEMFIAIFLKQFADELKKYNEKMSSPAMNKHIKKYAK